MQNYKNKGRAGGKGGRNLKVVLVILPKKEVILNIIL